MIELKNISKKFGQTSILEDVSLQIQKQKIYGLIGYNGVGKTTLLKIISGIYHPDHGEACIDGEAIFEHAYLKQQCFFMTEEVTFFPQGTLEDMRKFYKGYYPTWSDHTYSELVKVLGINATKSIRKFSKGMQRQAGLILAFSTHARYILLDEAFDGLDVGMRRLMENLIRFYVKKKDGIIVITSHNLRELEQLVDQVGMLKDGKLVLNESIDTIGGQLEEIFQIGRQEAKVEWEEIF